MGNYGIVVSKEGKDVSSTDVNDLILSSKYTTVKIVEEGLGTVTVGTAGQYGTINHNLGFIPMVIIYTELTPNSGNWFYSYPVAPTESTTLDDGAVGTSNAVFHLKSNVGSTVNIRYKYYIMGDSA